MKREARARRLNPVPLFAGVVGAVLVVGTLVGQGGHAAGDSDADMSGMSMAMPGMSMPGMSPAGGSDSGAMDPNTPGMDPNMPGMAATPNDGGVAAGTVRLRPGTAKTVGGMQVRLVKISHGRAGVQMGRDTATLRQGQRKKFADGMTVQAVKVKPDEATLTVSPRQ
jgi:uncharacterized protein involved in copper resistance